MKSARLVVRERLKKYFPGKAIIYEKAIFGVAVMHSDQDAPDVSYYNSVAYERVAQLINAPNDIERLAIVVDMQRYDICDDPTDFNSTVYDEYRERYKEALDRSQRKPEPVVGMYVCKNPKCRSDSFYVWSEQTRSSDEGMTHFRQCSKCGKRGKE